ncbi:MAG TPA: DUF397 domain-containing protein [Pseudonocardiaceae bacterium]|nr:DUF397 domain-containing protein [Pseudonocardiaceae bacterium]
MTGHSATSAYSVLPVDGWRTSSRCGPNGGNCVEVNVAETVVGVRDTKPSQSPVLVFGSAGWRSFVSAATGGGFNA